MNKTLIFAATLNEYPNIVTFLKRIEKLHLPIDILVIDDNSTDGTIDYLKNMRKKFIFQINY